MKSRKKKKRKIFKWSSELWHTRYWDETPTLPSGKP